ncbi:unnamed protein product, partial [Rotaria sordida]
DSFINMRYSNFSTPSLHNYQSHTDFTSSLPSQTQQTLNGFPRLVTPPTDHSTLTIEHQKNILNRNTTNMTVTELTSMNIYNNNHYEPLTPQTLPFDTYSPQSLSKSINNNNNNNNNNNIKPLIPSSTNVIMNTQPTTIIYASSSINKPTSSSSTLVNLLHQKRPSSLLDQSVSNNSLTKEKHTKSVKQTRKQPQKKTLTKQFLSVHDDIQHMPNPTQTMLNYPLTRKAKMQQRVLSRAASQEIPMNIPQQFTNPSSSLTNQQRASTSTDMSYLNNDMIVNTSPLSSPTSGQNAESKRRRNIKNGFESLRLLIPELSDPSNAKISKAQMLECTANHIQRTVDIRNKMKEEVDLLQHENEQLQQKISQYQTSLPVDGIPIIPATRRSREASYALFHAYVADRTKKNWRFYPYSLILKRIFDTFQNMVTCDSTEEFLRSLNEWKTNSLNLVQLRQAASQSVIDMGRITSLITSPECVPDECVQLATNDNQ